MDEDFRRAALDYHRLPRPGKLSVEPTKRMATQRDLALAYSPGVAAACEAIAADADAAYDYTARGNMVAVVTNGTAVPLEITATRFWREVRLAASAGSAAMASEAAATPGE